MFGLPSAALQWLGVGVLLVILGGLIRFRGWTFLIAGYDETSPVPEDAAANIVGNAVLRIGLSAVALGVLIALTEIPSYLPAVFGIVIVLAVGRSLYRLRTYESSGIR